MQRLFQRDLHVEHQDFIIAMTTVLHRKSNDWLFRSETPRQGRQSATKNTQTPRTKEHWVEVAFFSVQYQYSGIGSNSEPLTLNSTKLVWSGQTAAAGGEVFYSLNKISR